MSDLEETNPKLSPESELPPYRQADTLGNKPSSKMPLWLLPVLGIVLVIGVLLGKYWGAGDEALSDGSPTSASTQNDGKNPSDASTEQSVLSVETVMPSQDTIGNTLSALDLIILGITTSTISNVVKRSWQLLQERRRRTCAPSAASRESITLVSDALQYGQCILFSLS